MLLLSKAIDAVYFQGANKDGVYFVAATARRPHRVINGFVFLKVRYTRISSFYFVPDDLLLGWQSIRQKLDAAGGQCFTPSRQLLRKPLRERTSAQLLTYSYQGARRRTAEKSQTTRFDNVRNRR